MNETIQALLKKHGELLGMDLSAYHVYGSPMRPVSHSWARIRGAEYIQVVRATGYHTLIVVLTPLDKETVEDYELIKL